MILSLALIALAVAAALVAFNACCVAALAWLLGPVDDEQGGAP